MAYISNEHIHLHQKPKRCCNAEISVLRYDMHTLSNVPPLFLPKNVSYGEAALSSSEGSSCSRADASFFAAHAMYKLEKKRFHWDVDVAQKKEATLHAHIKMMTKLRTHIACGKKLCDLAQGQRGMLSAQQVCLLIAARWSRAGRQSMLLRRIKEVKNRDGPRVFSLSNTILGLHGYKNDRRADKINLSGFAKYCSFLPTGCSSWIYY